MMATQRKREVCERCDRPPVACYCHLIQQHSNRWPVHIVQHAAEQSHARGTALIAQLSLTAHATYTVLDRESFAGTAIPSADSAVLIYPDDQPNDAQQNIRCLQGLPPRPLIFVDGTWRKSKAIVLNSPYLRSLPRYTVTPSESPRYRVRKAARPDFYSILESIVTALTTLEQTEDFDQMLQVMDWMVEQQLRYRRAAE